MEFKVGDRVVLLRDFAYAKKGMKGVVKWIGEILGAENIGVEFDNAFFGAHSCNGYADPDRGHNIDPSVLKKIEPQQAFEVGDRVALTENYCSARKGMKGIIKGCDESRCAVEFDNDFDFGHNCDGLTKPRRGHYINPKFLKKIEPFHAFTLVITSKGDHTDAKLIHGKHTDKWVWVNRYKDDEYSEAAAVHAVIDKMFPEYTPAPLEEKSKRFTGKAVFNGTDRYFTQGNVYTFESGTTTDDDIDERGLLLNDDDWNHWFEENFVVINNPEEL